MPPDDPPYLRRRRRRRPSAFTKAWQLVAGFLLIIFAPIIGGPILPGPFGFLGFALGLALVLRHSRMARRIYIRFKRRWPHWGRWTDWGLRRGPRPALGAAAKLPNRDGQQREHRETGDRQQNGGIGQDTRKV